MENINFSLTVEVYGMNLDLPFDKRESHLMLGPIYEQYWIYVCSKQMLDRLLFAYGEKQGLNYAVFNIDMRQALRCTLDFYLQESVIAVVGEYV